MEVSLKTGEWFRYNFCLPGQVFRVPGHLMGLSYDCRKQRTGATAYRVFHALPGLCLVLAGLLLVSARRERLRPDGGDFCTVVPDGYDGRRSWTKAGPMRWMRHA